MKKKQYMMPLVEVHSVNTVLLQLTDVASVPTGPGAPERKPKVF